MISENDLVSQRRFRLWASIAVAEVLTVLERRPGRHASGFGRRVFALRRAER
jgi:hypothetical protein